MRNKTFKKIIRISLNSLFLFVFLFNFSFVFFSPTITFAQSSVYSKPYIPLAPLPGTTGSGGVSSKTPCNDTVNANGTSQDCPTDFLTYLTGGFKLAIAVASVLAVIMITYGGFEYMLSTIPGRKSNGREKITNALQGLVLALCSYLILYIINPELTVLKFVPTPAAAPTQGTEAFIPAQLSPDAAEARAQGQIAQKLRGDLDQAQLNLQKAQASGAPDQIQAAQAKYNTLVNAATMNSALDDMVNKEGYNRIQSLLASNSADTRTAQKIEQQMVDNAINSAAALRANGDNADADILAKKALDEKARIDKLLGISSNPENTTRDFSPLTQDLSNNISQDQSKLATDKANGASATQIAQDKDQLTKLQNQQTLETGLNSITVTNSPDQIKTTLNHGISADTNFVWNGSANSTQYASLLQAQSQQTKMLNDAFSSAATLKAAGDTADADIIFQRALDAKKLSDANINAYHDCLVKSYQQNITIKTACGL